MGIHNEYVSITQVGLRKSDIAKLKPALEWEKIINGMKNWN